IVIPSEKAIKSYLKIKSHDKIKVIPQGFDFKEIILSEYLPNEIPTFAYAGVFYKKIRNPTFFFDYLSKLDMNFKFVLYTSFLNSDSMDIVNKYKPILGDKLEIYFNIPRLKLITELSKMDFLINIDNIS